MNRFVLHILFLFIFCNQPIAQTNLIYNGSFEEYSSCPTGNDLNNGQLEKAKGWRKPTLGTSDYFNRCATSIVGVPTNFWGNQEPFQGDAYIGLVAACWNKNGDYCGFEYVQGKLLQPLQKCVEYRFSMYVSLAEKSTHAIGRLGALFTQNQIHLPNDSVINAAPQIYNQLIIEDSLEWYKISGNIIAQGEEQYITIGYFFPTVEHDTVFIQDYFVNEFGSYYYIDSISLAEIGMAQDMCEFISIPNIFTPNGDGINDWIDISEYLPFGGQMTIYNRWGNLITILDKDHPVWDGKTNGSDCSDGIYFYIFETNNHKMKKSGVIHLVR